MLETKGTHWYVITALITDFYRSNYRNEGSTRGQWGLGSVSRAADRPCLGEASSAAAPPPLTAPSCRLARILVRLPALRLMSSSVTEELFFTGLIGNVSIDSIIPYILKMETAEYNGQITGASL